MERENEKVHLTCSEAKFPSDKAACFLSASIELTSASISEFFAAKASTILDSTLVTSVLDSDMSCCSCFMCDSYDLLSSLCQPEKKTFNM